MVLPNYGIHERPWSSNLPEPLQSKRALRKETVARGHMDF